MLSFDTVHAITEHLVTATAPTTGPDLETYRLTQAPTLLVLDDQRAPAGALRLLRTLHIPLPADTAARQPLALLLHATAWALSRQGASHPIMQATHTPRAAGGQASNHRRQLAWAVRYIDIDVSTGAPQPVCRVDAIDVDSRFYQVSLLLGETCPVVHIDDLPDPHNSPATASGLAALATAAASLASTGASA